MPAEPFEKTSFRPILVPGRITSTLGAGYTLSTMDSAKRQRAAGCGVKLGEVGFVEPFYAYYDSNLLKRRNPHVPKGQLLKDIAEYRKLGVRILGVYPPPLQAEV